MEWHSWKTSQGNIGDHYMDRNILVYSNRCGPGSASSRIEFELTRHNHMKSTNMPFTVSACFKTPPPELRAEAWRILLRVTAGKELLPDHVQKYAREALERLGTTLPEDDDGDVEKAPVMGPGSASPMEEEVDWGADPAAQQGTVSKNETQHAYSEQVVESTRAVTEELAKEVKEETQSALERHAELVAARLALLPEFFQVTPGEAHEKS